MTTVICPVPEMQGAIMTALTAPGAPRALLVSLGCGGTLEHTPVEMGQSLLRIESELVDHLNAKPFDDEWLIMLRDYLDGRLAARAEAQATDGFVIPRAPGRWEIAHSNPFQPLVVRGAN
jgi:hypothetical protein